MFRHSYGGSLTHERRWDNLTIRFPNRENVDMPETWTENREISGRLPSHHHDCHMSAKQTKIMGFVLDLKQDSSCPIMCTKLPTYTCRYL